MAEATGVDANESGGLVEREFEFGALEVGIESLCVDSFTQVHRTHGIAGTRLLRKDLDILTKLDLIVIFVEKAGAMLAHKIRFEIHLSVNIAVLWRLGVKVLSLDLLA